jgi:hypothetical protein
MGTALLKTEPVPSARFRSHELTTAQIFQIFYSVDDLKLCVDLLRDFPDNRTVQQLAARAAMSVLGALPDIP